jgi:hypothetical protein
MSMKAFRFRPGEAMLTIVFLAIYFYEVASVWDDSILWLPVAIVLLAILLPAYLVSLLMWRHYFGGTAKKKRNWPGEL